jgi:hypothetical protein
MNCSFLKRLDLEDACISTCMIYDEKAMSLIIDTLLSFEKHRKLICIVYLKWIQVQILSRPKGV